MQTAIMNHYLHELKSAVGDRTTVELNMATIRHSRGKADSYSIARGTKTIDLSESPDGEPMQGYEFSMKEPDHTDERDEAYPVIRPFPENEGDIKFLQSVIDAARANF